MVALLAALAAAAVASDQNLGPKRAPTAYFAGEYALTFRVPTGATYCPLPRDWTGSNHGTILFLEPPTRCGGVGYPSSSRGFAPATVPRIHVYYGYDIVPEEDRTPEPPCKPVADARLLGRKAPICRDDRWSLGPEMVALTISGKYEADVAAETSITLITTPERLRDDLATFQKMLGTVRTCRSTWENRDLTGRITGTDHIGHGAPCPGSAVWF